MGEQPEETSIDEQREDDRFQPAQVSAAAVGCTRVFCKNDMGGVLVPVAENWGVVDCRYGVKELRCSEI